MHRAPAIPNCKRSKRRGSLKVPKAARILIDSIPQPKCHAQHESVSKREQNRPKLARNEVSWVRGAGAAPSEIGGIAPRRGDGRDRRVDRRQIDAAREQGGRSHGELCPIGGGRRLGLPDHGVD